MKLIALVVLSVGILAAEHHVVTIEYNEGRSANPGTYASYGVKVTPEKLKVAVGDTVTYKLKGYGTLIITLFTPEDLVHRRGYPDSVTITAKYAGYFKIGCSAWINGELEGWLAGDKTAGGEMEVSGGNELAY